VKIGIAVNIGYFLVKGCFYGGNVVFVMLTDRIFPLNKDLISAIVRTFRVFSIEIQYFYH